MNDDIKEIKQDVKEIKTTVNELDKKSAIHNELLKQHEARSIALQAEIEIKSKELDLRLKPIESHVNWITLVLKFSGIVLAGIAVQAGIKLFL